MLFIGLSKINLLIYFTKVNTVILAKILENTIIVFTSDNGGLIGDKKKQGDQ